MFVKNALEEIAQWRQQTGAAQHQLDWRWVERFRTLTAYDSYWWLIWTGTFTEEEQKEWDRLFALPQDETTKAQVGALMTASREPNWSRLLPNSGNRACSIPLLTLRTSAAVSKRSRRWRLRLLSRSPM